MAKKKKAGKAPSRDTALVALIAQIQDRLTKVTEDANTALAGLQEQVDRAWRLQDSREGVAKTNTAELEKFGKNVTASMYALRDSTQKAFTNTAKDIEVLKNRLHQDQLDNDLRFRLIETDLKVQKDFRRFIQEMAKGLVVSDTVDIYKT